MGWFSFGLLLFDLLLLGLLGLSLQIIELRPHWLPQPILNAGFGWGDRRRLLTDSGEADRFRRWVLRVAADFLLVRGHWKIKWVLAFLYLHRAVIIF